MVEEVLCAVGGEGLEVDLPFGEDVGAGELFDEGVGGGGVAEEEVEVGGVPVVGVEFAEGLGEDEADLRGGGEVAVLEEDAHSAAAQALVCAGGGSEEDGDEVEAGEGGGLELGGEGLGIDPGGADELEGHDGAAADGQVGELQEADPGVEEGGGEGGHVGGGFDPGEAGLVVEHGALPSLEGDDGEVEAGAAFLAEETGEFTDGHAVAEGDPVDAGEVAFADEEGAIHGEAADGVDAVEDDEADACLGGGVHGKGHGGDVGEEAAADVLHVEDEGVEVGELFGLRFAEVDAGVEAVDGEAGGFVEAALKVAFSDAAEAVFGGEEGGELAVGSLVKEVDGGLAVTGAAGLVGDEAELEAFEIGEVPGGEDIDAVADVGAWWGEFFCCGALFRFVGGGEFGGCGEIDVGEGLGGEGAELAAEGEDLAGFGGVVAVAEEEDGGFREGIDPERGAGPAGVAEGTDREEFAAGAGVGGVDVPAEAATGADVGSGLDGGHESDRVGGEEADLVEGAMVLEHPGEAGEVVGGGEESGVAGHAAHGAGGGVVNDAGEDAAIGEAGGGGDAGEEVGGGEEGGVGHAEGGEDLGGGEFVERLLGDAVDDLAEEDEVEVAVKVVESGAADGGFGAGEGDAVGVALPFVAAAQTGGEAGAVGEELADGDAGLVVVAGALGEIADHFFIEVEAALFDELQDGGGGGDDLGEGGGVEDGVEGHGHPDGFDASVAVGLLVDLAAVFEPEDAAGEVAVFDGAGDGAVEGLPGLGREGRGLLGLGEGEGEGE